jgi:hypothetical protein
MFLKLLYCPQAKSLTCVVPNARQKILKSSCLFSPEEKPTARLAQRHPVLPVLPAIVIDVFSQILLNGWKYP